MTVQINLQAAEHIKLSLLSEGIQELNRMMVAAGGSPLVLVSKNGDLCTPDGGGRLVPLTQDSMAALLRPVCIPGRLKKNDEDSEEPLFVEEPDLPRSLIRAYMETRHYTKLPEVRQVARTPVVRPDFTVRWEPGWDESTKCWVLNGLAEDRRLIDREDPFDIREVFDQFPLIDRRLVADCLAAAFTPLLSTAIESSIPGMIVAARKIGSGKTELAKFCSIIGNGEKTITTWRGATELGKMIETFVAEDNRVVIFDNIKNDIDSALLESVITGRTLTYRKMYSHASAQMRSNTSWFMTANGAIVSPDMVRRSVVVMLDKDAFPRGWDGSWPAKIEIGEAALVSLMCSLIENWRVAGCVHGSVVHPGFEEWSRVVSGILESAGVLGMWEARADVISEAVQSDDEDDAAVVNAIAAVMGGAEWAAGQLYMAAEDYLSSMDEPQVVILRGWMNSVVKNKKSKLPGVPVGKALHPWIGKTFDGCPVRIESRILNGSKVYRCVNVDGTELPEKHTARAGHGF